jgi:hypothetical protein
MAKSDTDLIKILSAAMFPSKHTHYDSDALKEYKKRKW